MYARATVQYFVMAVVPWAWKVRRAGAGKGKVYDMTQDADADSGRNFSTSGAQHLRSYGVMW
jgi:hypothetical protein